MTNDIETYVKEFVSYLLERNNSLETINTYRQAIRNFLKQVKKQPQNITYNDLGKYTRWVTEKYHPNSLTPKYSAVKSYLWYIKYKYNNHTIDNVMENKVTKEILKPPQWKYPDKDLLTKDEMQRLIKASSKEPRDIAILKTFLYTAQRRSSVEHINVKDINFNEQTVLIKAKGDIEYTVDIDPDALQSIKEYLETREKPKEGHRLNNYGRKMYHKDALFLDGYGKRLSGQGMYVMMKRYALDIGIGKSVYPHLWRSSAITLMDANGMTQAQIMEQSGHKEPKSLKTYIRPDRKLISTKVRQALSLNNIKPETELKPEPKPQPKPEPKKPTDTYIAKPSTDIEYNLTMQLANGVISEDTYKYAVNNLKAKETQEVQHNTPIYS